MSSITGNGLVYSDELFFRIAARVPARKPSVSIEHLGIVVVEFGFTDRVDGEPGNGFVVFVIARGYPDVVRQVLIADKRVGGVQSLIVDVNRVTRRATLRRHFGNVPIKLSYTGYFLLQNSGNIFGDDRSLSKSSLVQLDSMLLKGVDPVFVAAGGHFRLSDVEGLRLVDADGHLQDV